MYGGPQQGYFAQTVQSLTGIQKCPDINGGKPNCVSFTPNVSDSCLDSSALKTSVRLTPPIPPFRASIGMTMIIALHQRPPIWHRLNRPAQTGSRSSTIKSLSFFGAPTTQSLLTASDSSSQITPVRITKSMFGRKSFWQQVPSTLQQSCNAQE
jgi:hypothetical protein